MKNIVKLFVVAVVMFASGNLLAQYASTVTQFPFINGVTADGSQSTHCTNGLHYDDGTWENGYGWSPGNGTGKFVIKFTPTSYPYTINQFCIALTVNGGPTTWTFDIEVWDTTGTSRSPGTLVHSITNRTAAGIPTWPTVQWYDFNNLTGIPELQNGSYYVGISFNPVAGQYIGADQSTTTPLHPGYGYISNAWAPIQSYIPGFENYRCLGIRVEGSGPTFPHDYAVGPFLSLPAQFTQGQPYSIKAKVRNLGTSNETGVPIKFFIDNTQTGSTTLSLNAGATDSVSFPWTAAVGTHTLRIFSQLSTDQNRSNDTVQTSVTVLPGTPIYGGSVIACHHGLNLQILDNQTTWDSIQVTVPVWAFGIQDVNAYIDTVIHTWDNDLDFTLIHGGTSVIIINRRGGSGQNFIHTMLNDSAATPISIGAAPFSGSYSPDNPLSVFNGETANPNGYWTLRIHDNYVGDTGLLKAWCVIINYYTYVGGIRTIEVPNFYALGQNYPNPFNPTTKIQYAIPRAGDVQLVVYDILGRQVATLINGFKTAGIYTVDFDASLLSSGIYFYRIKSGSFTDTKKMLLVK
jgi:hypothetical protein